MRLKARAYAWAVVGVCGTGAAAHPGDIGLAIEGGRVVTLGITEVAPGVEELSPSRVFGADFFDQGNAVFTDEPGLFASNGTFAGGSSITAHVRSAVRRWTGADFSAVGPERLRLDRGEFSIVTPVTDVLTTGPSFAVPSLGGFDLHFEVFLTDINGISIDAGPVATSLGIYLLELEIESSQVGVARSEPVFVVYNWGLDEADHDLAIEYVQSALVPAPGAVGFLALGTLFATRRKRRAR